ncbi:MAG: hypothetical protein IKZ28_05360 [Clostridia bacterium]|nr:hypothetical protein [Clostridia bacterium]
MKKVICKKVYDTENSTLIKQVCFGEYGCPDGWEERLYQTEDGYFFLYVNGGETSKHPKENLLRISAEKKKAWLESHA